MSDFQEQIDAIKDPEQRAQFQEQFGFEELNPALGAYLYTTPSGITMLNHPLVQSVFHAPQLNKQMNNALKVKQRLLSEALVDGEWESYVFLHERPYRAQALARHMGRIPPEEYWRLLRTVWMDTENTWQWGRLKHKLLQARKPHRALLMSEDEHKMIASLGEIAPLIFRGYTPPGKALGWSWTFDRDKAEWFARRFMFDRKPHVAIGEVFTQDIIAYFEGRNEWEVVVDPKKVKILVLQEIGRENPDR